MEDGCKVSLHKSTKSHEVLVSYFNVKHVYINDPIVY